MKCPKVNINITQQVQKDNQEFVKRIYDNLKISYNISDFFYDIHNYYQNCNLLISRSGAATISELTYIGLPAILIPLPSATDDHQYHNAKALQDLGASWFYKQDKLNPEILARKIHDLITNQSLIKQASVNLLKRKKDGKKYLVSIILDQIT